MGLRVAVVGAGWAGLAAAVEASRCGHEVTLIEATRQAGGRARSLTLERPGGEPLEVDNGQHILIGAYRSCLQLMRQVGVDLEAVFLRLPLDLRFADGQGLALPRWPAPLDLAAGVLGARGWQARDKLSLLRTAWHWQRSRYHCPSGTTVQQLAGKLSPRVWSDLLEPLCLSALNTPPARAAGDVFLRVLHDALLGPAGSSHLLLPRVPLGRLFPEAALAVLRRARVQLLWGQRVQGLRRTPQGWHLQGGSVAAGAGTADAAHWRAPFDRVLLACPPWEAARLADSAGLASWAAQARALPHEGIATVYVSSPQGLARPMLALRAGPQAPAQFAFDRGRLGGPPGLLALVISASQGEREVLQAQALAQLAQQTGLHALRALQTVVEKRATFSCTPGLQRPAGPMAPGLWACGDYVHGPYPATLEGAVRSAQEAVAGLQTAWREPSPPGLAFKL